MASQNTSSAYDLSAFQPEKKRRVQPKPNLSVVGKSRRMASAMVSPKAVCVFAIVVTLASLLVHNQVQLNEVNSAISKIGQQIGDLENENVRLQSRLESTMSPNVVAQRAKDELGMDRATKYQTEYIYLFANDEIERSEKAPEQGIPAQSSLSIGAMINGIKEYID